jgi:hypothetical protein
VSVLSCVGLVCAVEWLVGWYVQDVQRICVRDRELVMQWVWRIEGKLEAWRGYLAAREL